MDSKNYKKVGEWGTWEQLAPQLVPGDLIEIDRAGGKFQHWGVMVETVDGKAIVVNVNGDFLTGLGAIVGSRGEGCVADIRVEELSKAVGGPDPVRFNNSIDEKFEPYPTCEQVIKRGLSQMGEHKYSVWENNCQHWASWCRNGNLYSVQAEEAEKQLAEMKDKPKDDAEKAKKDLSAKMEELKMKNKAQLEKMKGKLDELVNRGPPTPAKVKIPDDVMKKLPFLKKFEGEKVE